MFGFPQWKEMVYYGNRAEKKYMERIVIYTVQLSTIPSFPTAKCNSDKRQTSLENFSTV